MQSEYSESENHQFRLALEKIRDKEPNTIRSYVAEEALEYTEDQPTSLFHDLARCGCKCGTVRDLIYYYDTRAFFDLYYEDIEWLREEYEESTGESIRIVGDLKNWLAWFAFEETAFQIANELEIDF